MNTERINWDFAYHAPDEEKKRQHENIRAGCRQLTHLVDRSVPDSREKSLAITHLEEAMFWANAAIARSFRSEE